MSEPYPDIPDWRLSELSPRVRGVMRPMWQWIQQFSIDNPVTSAVIEATFGISGSEVRDICRVLRQASYVIGSDTRGYWFPRTLEEGEPTRKHLLSRLKALRLDLDGYEIWANRTRTGQGTLL